MGRLHEAPQDDRMASRGRGTSAGDKAWLIAPKKIVRGFRAERARVLTHVVGMLVVSGVDGLVLPEAG